jgi:hypothetical protein
VEGLGTADGLAGGLVVMVAGGVRVVGGTAGVELTSGAEDRGGVVTGTVARPVDCAGGWGPATLGSSLVTTRTTAPATMATAAASAA